MSFTDFNKDFGPLGSENDFGPTAPPAPPVLVMPSITAYRGPVSEIRTGGTSVVALFGPLLDGLIVNPATTQDQGIEPLLSYSQVQKEFLQGPLNTYEANSLPPLNASNEVTRTVTITTIGPPEILYVSLVGPATLEANGTTVAIYPGQSFRVPKNCGTNVWVNAASSGHRFTAIAIQPATQFPPTQTVLAFPPTGPTGLTKALPSYLYQQYSGDDDLQAFVMSYNELAQAFVDWFNDLNLPIYTQLSGGLLDWVGQGLYGLARPTLFSGVAKSVGPLNTWLANALGPNMGGIVDDITDITVTSDDVYKRIITWFFYKGDGKQTSVEWLKRRIYRFLYGTNGTDAAGPTDQISVAISASNQITITIITGIRKTTAGALCNGFGFNSTMPNSGAWSLTQYQMPAVAPQFQEAIESAVLETPFQFSTTCRIGFIGMAN